VNGGARRVRVSLPRATTGGLPARLVVETELKTRKTSAVPIFRATAISERKKSPLFASHEPSRDVPCGLCQHKQHSQHGSSIFDLGFGTRFSVSVEELMYRR
jgi:hypothetical protein